MVGLLLCVTKSVYYDSIKPKKEKERKNFFNINQTGEGSKNQMVEYFSCGFSVILYA